MKRKLLLILAITLAFALVLGACAGGSAPAAEPSPAPAPEEPAGSTEPAGGSNYDIRLGVIQPGPEFYYQRYSDSVKAGAEAAGMTPIVMLSEWDSNKEISNVEDLISQGIDAIVAYSTSNETAQRISQLSNEAGIPIFLTAFAAADGPGVPTSTIDNSFYDMGATCGTWLVDNFEGSAKILEIQGLLGQGIAEGISTGFADMIAERSDLEVVAQYEAKWDRSLATAITEDALASGLDFDMIFVHNEDMCSGVVNVLKGSDALDRVNIITQNGSDDGIAMIRAGEVLMTCANPPSTIAGDTLVILMKYLDGKPFPEHYHSPVFMIDKSNVDDPDNPTWDVRFAVKAVEEYMRG